MECQGYFQVLLAMAVFWNKDWIENVFIFFIVVWLSCFGDSLLGAEAAITGVLWKKVVLEISQNLQENTCEFCEISKNTFSYRTPLMLLL